MTAAIPEQPLRADDGRRGSDFAALSRRIQRAGLLRRRRGFYYAVFAADAAMLAGGWTAFGLLGDSWWQLLTAVFLAIVSTQLAFIGHDAGHKQIFGGTRANRVVGHVQSGVVGVSFTWWVSKHNRHHANPNREERDPDVNIATLAFDQAQASYKRGFYRLLAKHQAWLFVPMLALEGISLHIVGAVEVLRGRVARGRLDLVLLAAHLAAYLTAVFVVLSPGQALAFIAVHQAAWGIYMGFAFAPNHKGMPLLGANDKLDFLRKQVLTSRNVVGGHVVDFALGGLNYQIEHHLFPSMPRPNLRHAQRIVQRFCAEHGIAYSQCGVLSSYAKVFRHLHEVGAPLR
jgi:fatty acid desaturase